MKIIELLKKYQSIRDTENESFGTYKMVKPEALAGKTIQTLEDGFYRPLSPMLRERFEFCSLWENAYLGQNWLGISEIENWKKNAKIVECIELTEENSYPGDPMVDLPKKNIAIFAYDPYYLEVTFLLWDDLNEEPKICYYFGGDVYMFNSFERFLLYITGEIEEDDSITEYVE